MCPKPPVPYTYVVAPLRRRTPGHWSLAVHGRDGLLETLAVYRRRAKAVSAARLLAFPAGQVEVRA